MRRFCSSLWSSLAPTRKAVLCPFLGILVLMFAAAPARGLPVDIRLDLNNQYLPAGNWNWVDSNPSSRSNLIDYNTGLPTSVDVALGGLQVGG